MRIETLENNARRFWGGMEQRLGGWERRNFCHEAKGAVERGRVNEAEVLSSLDKPSFGNTIDFLENADKEYLSILGDYHGLSGLVRNARLVSFEKAVAKIEEVEEKRELKDDRWALRVRELKKQKLHMTREQGQLVDDYYLGYKTSGAYLTSDVREELTKLNAGLSRLELRFSQKLKKEVRNVIFGSAESLEGLDGDEIRQARALARSVGEKGWAIRLDPTVCQDVAKRLTDPKLKLKLTRAGAKRGAKLESVVLEIAQTRLKIAKLLGFKSWTHLKLIEGNAKKPERIWSTFQQCLPRIRKMADRDISLAKSEGWDAETMSEDSIWSFLPPESALPSYEPEKVLEKGCFLAGEKLFGLKFEKLEGAVTYHKDAQVYVVRMKGRTLGFLIADFWQREGKDNGAWALAWEGQRDKDTYPVVSICFNFARRGRCEFTGVTTIFHEFGHALHAIFTSGLPPSQAGLECPNDFVEIPSQLAEHWAYDREIYSSFRSEESPDLSDVSKTAGGTGLTYLASIISAGADLLWHGEKASFIKTTESIDDKARKMLATGTRAVSPRYKSSYFEHIFNCGYDASYYSYLWCELKAGQVASWMRENGGLNRKVGKQILQSVYQAGGNIENAGSSPLWNRRKGKLIFE